MPARPAPPADPPPISISVAGTGRVAVSPDLADLRLGVTLTARTVAAARAANAKAMTAVIGSLKSIGIEAGDIQTANLSLSPAYDYSRDQSPPRLVGFTYANAVAATIRDLAKLGAAIDGALEAGATSLDGIGFRLADPSAAEHAARVAAVEDARAKAEALAAAAGLAVVGIASITEGGGAIPFPALRGEMALAARDLATPVEAGTNDVVVTVAVTYRVQ